MKTYTFTYFAKLDGDEYLNSREFTVRCAKFTQAFKLFVEFFNSLVPSGGIKDFAYTYRIVTDNHCYYRSVPSKYWSYLHTYVPEV